MRNSSKAGWIKQHTSSTAVKQGQALKLAAFKKAGITPPIKPSPLIDESFEQYLEDLGSDISKDFGDFKKAIEANFKEYLSNS